MKSSKFITLLESLSNKEFKDFERYIHSFYSSRERELFVFKAISIEGKGINKKVLNQISEVNKSFKKEGITPIILKSNILPKLVNIIEEFLMWQKFKNLPDNYQKEKLKLLIYEEKSLSKLYSNKVDSLFNTINKQKESNTASLHLLDVFDYIYFKNANKKKFINKKEIDLIHQYLDAYYIEKKLKYSCEAILFKGIYGDTSDILFLGEIKKIAQYKPFKENIFNEVHLLIIELSEQPDVTNYKLLKKKIKSIQPKIPSKEQALYYGFLMNYISKELKVGNNFYIPEIQDWVDYGIKANFILENGFLPLPLFLNFISVICIGEDFEEAKTFSENYLQFLNENEQEAGRLISWAEIKFRKKEFESIVKKLSDFSFFNPIVNLRARMLIMIVLYEEDKTSIQLTDYIHSFDIYCRRAKNLGKDNKQAALNLIKFTRRLLKKEIGENKFKTDLNNSGLIFYKSWLNEKLMNCKV